MAGRSVVTSAQATDCRVLPRVSAADILGTELASKPLARLTTGDLRALYSARLEAGLARTTVHHLHAVIRRALGVAHRDGVIPRNVAALLDKGEKPGMGRSPMRALQDEEPERFLDAVRGEPLEALFTLAITAGLRQGELLGLRWRDVDLGRGVLSVTSSLQLGRDGTLPHRHHQDRPGPVRGAGRRGRDRPPRAPAPAARGSAASRLQVAGQRARLHQQLRRQHLPGITQSHAGSDPRRGGLTSRPLPRPAAHRCDPDAQPWCPSRRSSPKCSVTPR